MTGKMAGGISANEMRRAHLPDLPEVPGNPLDWALLLTGRNAVCALH